MSGPAFKFGLTIRQYAHLYFDVLGQSHGLDYRGHIVEIGRRVAVSLERSGANYFEVHDAFPKRQGFVRQLTAELLKLDQTFQTGP